MCRRLGALALPSDVKVGLPIATVIRSPEFSQVEAVVHCAAVQLFTPGLDLRAYETFEHGNVRVLDELLAASTRTGVRKFVHISTDMVYGVPAQCPIPESADLRPVGFYGRSKVRAEALVRAASKEIQTVTVFRPRVIGGPGRKGLFVTLARLAAARLPIPLIGSGLNRYQLIHVEDLAELIVEALERDVPGVFNAGALEVSTIREELQVAARCLGVRPMFVPVPEPLAVGGCALLHRLRLGPVHPEQYLTLGRDFVLSIERALAHFSWRPRFSDVETITDSFRALARGA